MTEFKEKITKVKRAELKAWIEKLSNGELAAVTKIAATLLKEREKAFWENPPEEYWRSVKHACGHTERYLFSNLKIDIASELDELKKYFCIHCLYKKLNAGNVPELVGFSLKQKEFARVIRISKVSHFLNNLSNVRLQKALLDFLVNNQSSWWIDIRFFTIEEMLNVHNLILKVKKVNLEKAFGAR